MQRIPRTTLAVIVLLCLVAQSIGPVSAAPSKGVRQQDTCYSLTLSVEGGGGLAPTADSPNCAGGLYRESTVVALTAMPSDGFRVARWSGTDSDDSTSTTNTVTMTADRHVVVTYEGVIGTEAVFDPDGRSQVTVTTQPPWRTIAKLRSRYPNGLWYGCTGWFVGPGTLATAAHCVYAPDKGGWATNVIVYPGRNGDTLPYDYTAVTTASLRKAACYTGSNEDCDYGAIIMPDNEAGNLVGWYAYRNMTDSQLQNMLVSVSGYPGDKPYGTLWTMTDSINGLDADYLRYHIDTYGGQSGSPVWWHNASEDVYYSVGIHVATSELCHFYWLNNNCAKRIDASVVSDMLEWGAATSPPPIPSLTSLPSNQTVYVNEPFSFSVQARNNGASAQYGGISVSFPQLTQDVAPDGGCKTSYSSSTGNVSTASGTSFSSVCYYDKNDTIHGDDGPMNAQYLLVEEDESWASGGTETVRLTFTPKQTGAYEVYIRVWMSTNGHAAVYRDPDRDDSYDRLDQQDYRVIRRVFTAQTRPAPNAPTNLTATAVSQTQINLSWQDNSGDESDFHIERSPTGSGSWTQIATVPANTTSYQNNTGLSCGTPYWYRVRAHRHGDGQYSGYSNTATATTQACSPPSAPTNMTATAVSQTQINLSWQDNSGDESDFHIERSPTGSGSWTQIATVPANTTSYQNNTGLSCGTSYWYRVRAHRHGDGQYSSYSNTPNATTLACSPPSAPTNLTATAVSQIQINLSWQDNSSDESDFHIERSPTGSGSWTEIATVSANTTSYPNTGLGCGTTYYYRVRAHRHSDGQYSGYSNTANATTQACAGPNAPSNLTAAAVSQTQINLSWQDNSSDESDFHIERSPTGTGSWTEIATVSANTTSYVNTGLGCGTTYYYRVRAHRHSDGQYSGYSNVDSATTQDCAGPNAPSSLAAAAVSQTQIDLSWQDNSSDESDFHVERSPTGTGSWTEIATVSANTTSYANTGLGCGTTYYYRVRAHRHGDGQYSSYSNTANATTQGCGGPSAPSNLTAAAVSQTQINLTWQDNSGDESDFHIERSPTGSGSWTEIATVSANTTSYANTGLGCGTTYYYQVRAHRHSDGQYSGYSNVDGATTQACAGGGSVFIPLVMRSYSGSTGPTGPQVRYASQWIDDDTWGNSYGNDNGVANPGEFLEVYLELENPGDSPAYGVYAVPSAADPYVNPYGVYFYDDYLSYGDIAASSSSTGDDFDFMISSNAPSGHVINFDLHIYDSDGHHWTDNFSITVVGSDTTPPRISYADVYPKYASLGTPTTINAFIEEGGNINSAFAYVESPDETVLGTITLYDDGAHNDGVAGDRSFAGAWTPTTEADFYVDFEATDDHANTGTADNLTRFTSRPFTETADILLVIDQQWDYGYEGYCEDALSANGFPYDLWDSFVRGSVDSSTLDQYVTGVVIYSVPDYGYLENSSTQSSLMSYLDSGGRLFITGQDIGYYLTEWGTMWNEFYSDYLHATYVQDDIGLYVLNGVSGDPIGDGYYLAISGGDGANNQYYPDEIDPIAPAVTVFGYDPASTASAHPSSGEEEERARRSPEEDVDSSASVHAEGISSSGTGAIRVDTGTYKVVYFSFGFEAINDLAGNSRAEVMERVLSWLQPGIYGKATENGIAASGLPINLYLNDGSSFSLVATAPTEPEGTYRFAGLPSLGPGEEYWVVYENTAGAPGRLAVWLTWPITSYTAGSRVHAGDFDIADISLVSPAHGATVSLPHTFYWDPRPATPSDDYEFELCGDTCWGTDPALGYVGSYTLNSLPTGFSAGTQYFWGVFAYGADGYGISYEGRSVTFSNAGVGPTESAVPDRTVPPEDMEDFLRRW